MSNELSETLLGRFWKLFIMQRESTAHNPNWMTHVMCYWLFRGPHVCYCLSESLTSPVSSENSKQKIKLNSYSECRASRSSLAVAHCGVARPDTALFGTDVILSSLCNTYLTVLKAIVWSKQFNRMLMAMFFPFSCLLSAFFIDQPSFSAYFPFPLPLWPQHCAK